MPRIIGKTAKPDLLNYTDDQLKLQRAHEPRLLKEIQVSIEGLYQNGRPLYHLESARSTAYDAQSSIYVVDFVDFKKMKPRDVQDVFRHRHILVLGVEVDELEFDLPGLATMGSLNVPRQMQGDCYRRSCIHSFIASS
jgi:hypothetical protein